MSESREEQLDRIAIINDRLRHLCAQLNQLQALAEEPDSPDCFVVAVEAAAVQADDILRRAAGHVALLLNVDLRPASVTLWLKAENCSPIDDVREATQRVSHTGIKLDASSRS